MRLIFQDYVFYLFLVILIGLGAWEMIRYYKSVNCYFCKRRGMWYQWKDKQGLPQPICDKHDCIERALEERMTAVWT